MTDLPQQTIPLEPPVQPSAQPVISGPLTLGSLIDRAFRLYRGHFGVLLMTAAVFLVPLGIATGILTGSFMTGYLGMIDNMIALGDSPTGEPDFEEFVSIFAPFAGYAGFYILLIFAGLVLQGIVTLSLTAHSLAILRGKALTVRESISTAMNRLPAFIGKSIVQWLIIAGATLGIIAFFGCAIVLIAMTAFGGFAFLDGSFESPNEPSVIAMVGIGMTVLCLYLFAIVLMFVPTLYFSGRYISATVGIVDQNWGPVESLRKSWALTKGRIWRCTGYFFLLGLLTLIFINVPIAVAQNIAQLLVGIEMYGSIVGLSTAATSLMAVLWTPFQVAALVLFYFDLRVRQENYDLELRLEQLEAAA